MQIVSMETICMKCQILFSEKKKKKKKKIIVCCVNPESGQK